MNYPKVRMYESPEVRKLILKHNLKNNNKKILNKISIGIGQGGSRVSKITQAIDNCHYPSQAITIA